MATNINPTNAIYAIAGVVILAMLYEAIPQWGGWLILLVIVALLKSPKILAIITPN